MLVRLNSGEVVDLTTGQARRLIQAGEATETTEPVKHDKPKLARGRKTHDKSDVAGSLAGDAT